MHISAQKTCLLYFTYSLYIKCLLQYSSNLNTLNNYWGHVLNMTLSSESDSIYLQMKYKTENVDILYL